MWFIGDVHCRFLKYLSLVTEWVTPAGGVMDCSLQVGDMGVGLPARGKPPLLDESPIHEDQPLLAPREKRLTQAPILSAAHKFIRGNHDNPALCREHPCYLGDYGYLRKQEMCFVGGGYSVDFSERKAGFDWWSDEELPPEQLAEIVESFGDWKSRIVVSHECPTVAKEHAVCNFSKISHSSRTETALQRMFEIHRPEIWVFGHHHYRVDVRIRGTRFVGLNEMIRGPIEECVFEIPGLKW
ncbi:MAG TPA: hypothetical protein DCX07_15540 [Phycisphaerales bacterium]|nr:hypothetical protein [Phycisphaerales bacterium]